MASANYPLGKKGHIIGTPYHGTHTLGNWQSDNALDIAVPVGTPVYAVTAGVIGSRIGPLSSTNPRFAGNRVTLEGAGNSYYYAHLSKLTVKAGEHVIAGQLLGYSGEANGVAHLHFAVENGTPGDAIRGQAPPASAQTDALPVATPDASTPAPASQAAPLMAPPVGTPPGSQDPSLEFPGTAQHYLPGQGAVAGSWQAVASLPDLSPDTQRLIALSGGG